MKDKTMILDGVTYYTTDGAREMVRSVKTGLPVTRERILAMVRQKLPNGNPYLPHINVMGRILIPADALTAVHITERKTGWKSGVARGTKSGVKIALVSDGEDLLVDSVTVVGMVEL